MILLHAPKDLPVSPLEAFSVLMLGQGYEGAEGLFEQHVNTAWNKLQNEKVPPFELTKTVPGRFAIAVYKDPGIGLDLAIAGPEAGKKKLKVETPDETRTRLRQHLAAPEHALKIGGKSVSAGTIWPTLPLAGRTGRIGALVVILRNPAGAEGPGEYYELPVAWRGRGPDEFDKFVAVTVTGDNWWRLIARAIGQILAGLTDEWSEPNNEAPTGVSAARLQLLLPNVLLIDDDDVQNNSLDTKTLARLPWQWGHHRTLTLFKGGAGFSKNAFRSESDCLMRRKPYDEAAPIQAEVDFCEVCQNALKGAIRGSVDEQSRIRLDNQETRFASLRGSGIASISTYQIARQVLESPLHDEAAEGNKWRCEVSVTETNGLVIENVELLGRKDPITKISDPFAAVTKVIDRIRFEDLAVELEGEAAIPLVINDALKNSETPPVLRTWHASDKTDKYQAGIELTLTWRQTQELPWAIQVVMSLTLKSVKNDFDPGGAVQACKLYPQLAIKVLEPKRAKNATNQIRKRVATVRGTIAWIASNVIPVNTVDPNAPHHLKHMETGKHSVLFVTDSNSSDYDSAHSLNYESALTTAAEIAATLGGPPPPAFGLWSAKRERGRLLGGVKKVEGGSAFFAHRTLGAPVLALWSWLFDYVRHVLLPDDRNVQPPFDKFTAVYALSSSRKTPSGLDEGRTRRDKPLVYPPLLDPAAERTVVKLPRQGAWDSVHLTAFMGHEEGDPTRHIAPAPFCADLCMHTHWRWGTVAVGAAREPYAFLGWGDGMEDRGAFTVLGAPLIPPNQELDVTVKNLETNTPSRVELRYTVTVHEPRIGNRNVFLEQGLGVAFTYGGLLPEEMVLVALGSGAISAFDGADWTARLNAVGPAKDWAARELFMKIYASQRYFNPAADDPDVMQVPLAFVESMEL